jgi:hypothetical protein
MFLQIIILKLPTEKKGKASKGKSVPVYGLKAYGVEM